MSPNDARSTGATTNPAPPTAAMPYATGSMMPGKDGHEWAPGQRATGGGGGEGDAPCVEFADLVPREKERVLIDG